MTLAEFTKQTFEEKNGYCYRPRIFCVDGFNMSVQGSKGHYCSPRATENYYHSMEIGFPSEEEELIMTYAETPNDPTQTVYGYVPCGVIQDVINKHGGIDVEKTFNANTNE